MYKNLNGGFRKNISNAKDFRGRNKFRNTELDYIPSNGAEVDGWQIGQDMDGSGSILCEVPSSICLQGLKKINQYGLLCLSRDSNSPPPPEY
jgi:hypothetical protein